MMNQNIWRACILKSYGLSNDMHHQRINIYNCLLDSASQGMRVGVNLALAIALHNIPEVHILSIRNLWRRSYLPTYIAHLIKRNLKRIPHYYYFYVFPVWKFVFHYKAISKTSKQLDLIFFYLFDMLPLLPRCDIFRVWRLHFLYTLQQRGKNMVAYGFTFVPCILRGSIHPKSILCM